MDSSAITYVDLFDFICHLVVILKKSNQLSVTNDEEKAVNVIKRSLNFSS